MFIYRKDQARENRLKLQQEKKLASHREELREVKGISCQGRSLLENVRIVQGVDVSGLLWGIIKHFLILWFIAIGWNLVQNPETALFQEYGVGGLLSQAQRAKGLR